MSYHAQIVQISMGSRHALFLWLTMIISTAAGVGSISYRWVILLMRQASSPMRFSPGWMGAYYFWNESLLMKRIKADDAYESFASIWSRRNAIWDINIQPIKPSVVKVISHATGACHCFAGSIVSCRRWSLDHRSWLRTYRSVRQMPAIISRSAELMLIAYRPRLKPSADRHQCSRQCSGAREHIIQKW